MKNLIILFSFVALLNFEAISSHNPGGDVRIEQIGANQFVLHYRLLTDGSMSLSVNIIVKIFDAVTNNHVITQTILRDSSKNYFNGKDSIELYYYSDTINLNNNPNGYYSVYSNCCRGATSVGGGGIVYSCDIPDPAIFGSNSNPNFSENPAKMSLCLNQSKSLDFSCIDTDGDSLVYSLIQPYSTAPLGIKPFHLITYNAGFSLSNILGSGSVCTINSVTGIVTTLPRQLGLYIIAVKCEEYRNGIKIGEVVRDITIPALNCSSVALEENQLDKLISVYPNPSNGLFKTETPLPTIITVYNVYGIKVLEQQLNDLTNEIDLKNCAKGIYTLQFISENQTVFKRIVVN